MISGRATIFLFPLVLFGPSGVRTVLGQEFTLFPLPLSSREPSIITTGPDGNLWFTATGGNSIGRMTTRGVLTEFPLPPVSTPIWITASPDGALWFTNRGTSTIGRITTGGLLTEFALPTYGSSPAGITVGPDGALWFAEESLLLGNRIGRITLDGMVTEFPIPTPGSATFATTVGPDGNVWFTEVSADQIGRITTAGVITEFPLPPGSTPEESYPDPTAISGSQSEARLGLGGSRPLA